MLRLIVTSVDSTLRAGGEGEALLVLGCFFLDNSYLVDLFGPVYPCVDGVGDGDTTPGATIFGITRGSSALTQESEGTRKNSSTGLLLVYLPEDISEDNSVYINPLTGGKGIE
ncbi:hypothetical protein M9H77_23783 [Catharanthus roseus]|uniref:Uncharacterized protein n=1 Tax=Catharanthus roseus TaxID=4058 RepID=A0ACC0AW03_CATRO|nr:hypothetical protein M9H77_23783 [Catharanthus roseus]